MRQLEAMRATTPVEDRRTTSDPDKITVSAEKLTIFLQSLKLPQGLIGEIITEIRA